MDDATLTRLRPADQSYEAVAASLVAVREEEEAALQRLTELKNERITHLLTATTAQIRETEENTRTAEVELLQLAAMKEALATELDRAREREAVAGYELQVAKANELVEKYNEFFRKHYPKHAAAIAASLKLEQDAQAAIYRLHFYGRGEKPSIYPLCPERHYTQSLAKEVRLPGHWWPMPAPNRLGAEAATEGR